MSEQSKTIMECTADDLAARMDEFRDLLQACVEAGASISFVLPHTPADSAAFWTAKVLPAVREGRIVLLAAHHGDRLVGAVQMIRDTPPNQPHRVEVAKLMVHPDHRQRGIARALMAALEARAAAAGRTLITLDTRTGDNAEPLYRSLGYVTAGIIPGYALNTFRDGLHATTIMYKTI